MSRGIPNRLCSTSTVAILGLCLGLAAAFGPAQAEKVGVAAAVNPDAFSTLSGAPQGQLNIGKSIFYNERINTTGSGQWNVIDLGSIEADDVALLTFAAHPESEAACRYPTHGRRPA